jgi:hypothetical protein
MSPYPPSLLFLEAEVAFRVESRLALGWALLHFDAILAPWELGHVMAPLFYSRMNGGSIPQAKFFSDRLKGS